MDLDLTCTARLEVYDVEREKRQLEAMGAKAATGALEGAMNSESTGERKRPKPLNA